VGRVIRAKDEMVVGAGKSGNLLVRADAEHHEALLDEPGATQAQMGAGRDMGPGWITIAPEAIADDERLAFWVDVARDHNRTLTGGESEGKRSKRA